MESCRESRCVKLLYREIVDKLLELPSEAVLTQSYR